MLNGYKVIYAKTGTCLDQHFREIGPKLLSKKEFGRLERYVKKSDRDLSLIGKFMLFHEINRAGLSIANLKAIDYTSFNRPHMTFENRFLDFNISHSGNVCILAFSLNQRIGIDIEEIRDIGINDFDSIFTPSERLWINNDKVRFFTLWTRKESVLKAIGIGLYKNLEAIEVAANFATIDGTTFHFQRMPVPKNYLCTVASMEENSRYIIESIDIDSDFLESISEKFK